MKRLARLDVTRGFRAQGSRGFVQVAFGAGCALAMIGLRTVLDMVIATSGPFALVYPTVLIATLFGRALAGVVATFLSFAWAWYFVLIPVHSFTFVEPTDPGRVAVNFFAVIVVLLLAEAWRSAVAAGIEERDEEIGRRILLQQELEHRTKNNFALAASLLEMQKRREAHPDVAQALEQAIARIHSFAAAYANLAERQGEGAVVAMREYLVEVVDRVTRGAFHDNVRVEVEADNCTMPREVAVAIGLFTNEALTNCAKYAFPGGRAGSVAVRFDSADGRAWTLDIADDGIGNAGADGEAVPASSGIGARLMEAFAQQARASYQLDSSDKGRRLRLAGHTAH